MSKASKKKKSPVEVWEDLCVGYGLANLVFFKAWSDLTRTGSPSQGTEWSYELFSISTQTYVALILNISLIALVFFGLQQWARRREEHRFTVLVHTFFLIPMFFLFNGIRLALGLGYLSAQIGKPIVFGGFGAALLFVFYLLYSRGVLMIRLFRC